MTTQQVGVGLRDMDSDDFLNQLQSFDVGFLPSSLPDSKIFFRRERSTIKVAHQVSRTQYACYRMPVDMFIFFFNIEKEEKATKTMEELLLRFHRMTAEDEPFRKAIDYRDRKAPREVEKFLNWEWSHLTAAQP